MRLMRLRVNATGDTYTGLERCGSRASRIAERACRLAERKRQTHCSESEIQDNHDNTLHT